MAHERSVINAPGAAAVGFNDLNWLKDSVDDFAHELPSLLFDDKARDGGFHKLVRSVLVNCGDPNLAGTSYCIH